MKKARSKPVPKKHRTITRPGEDYTVEASYDHKRHGWGVLDKKIEQVARGKLTGSGTALGPGGYRDIVIRFPTRRAMNAAVKRLRKSFRGYRLRVKSWGPETG